MQNFIVCFIINRELLNFVYKITLFILFFISTILQMKIFIYSLKLRKQILSIFKTSIKDQFILFEKWFLRSFHYSRLFDMSCNNVFLHTIVTVNLFIDEKLW